MEAATDSTRLSGRVFGRLKKSPKSQHWLIDLGALRLEYQMRATREHQGANAWVPISKYLTELEDQLNEENRVEPSENWIVSVVRPECERLYNQCIAE